MLPLLLPLLLLLLPLWNITITVLSAVDKSKAAATAAPNPRHLQPPASAGLLFRTSRPCTQKKVRSFWL